VVILVAVENVSNERCTELEEALDVYVTNLADDTVVTVFGELDMVSASTLQAVLNTLEPGRTVVVDCAGVPFLDSTGVRALLLAQRRMEDDGGSLRIRKASPPVRLVVETGGLALLLEPDDG
jgi:anti-anti-sigma factor